MARALLIAAVAGVLGGAVCQPALAAFPGKNGRIAFTESGSST
jgi:hypothetical protein